MYAHIEKKGGKAIMWRTGHSHLKAALKEFHAQLAGEMSGHIFFKHRWYGFDDAIYSGARLLEIVASGKKPLSAHFKNIPGTADNAGAGNTIARTIASSTSSRRPRTTSRRISG
jgi:phosphomannomutase/phosphoglucomutase